MGRWSLGEVKWSFVKVTDLVSRGARTYTWDFLLQVQCSVLYCIIPMNGSFLSIQWVFKELLEKVFSVYVPKGPKNVRWEFPGWPGKFIIPWFCRIQGSDSATESDVQGDSTTDLRSSFNQRSRAIPFFSAWGSGKHLVLAWLGDTRRKGGKDKATSVWFDAGIDLFHFLALCMTLMKESGSLSQEHGRTGSKNKQ